MITTYICVCVLTIPTHVRMCIVIWFQTINNKINVWGMWWRKGTGMMEIKRVKTVGDLGIVLRGVRRQTDEVWDGRVLQWEKTVGTAAWDGTELDWEDKPGGSWVGGNGWITEVKGGWRGFAVNTQECSRKSEYVVELGGGLVKEKS